MARPNKQSRADSLDKAMRLFWTKGFHATSMKDLERATGLQPGSLYYGFGNKQALFCQAIATYNHQVVSGRIQEHMLDAPVPLTGLQAFFLTSIKKPEHRLCGCFLTNSAVELGTTITPAHKYIREGQALIQNAIVATLTRARKQDQLTGGVDIAIQANLLLAFYQGLIVLGKSGHTKSMLTGLIKQTIGALRNPARTS